MTEKNGRNTVLGDLFVVFVLTLMMVKLGKSRKMEDCKKRENYSKKNDVKPKRRGLKRPKRKKRYFLRDFLMNHKKLTPKMIK